MRVFVTGASGFVGSAVVRELRHGGHSVLGLARSEDAAKKIEASGAEVLHGNIEDLQSLRAGAEGCDGIIHCGFNHDFSRFQENCDNDRKAIAAMAEVIRGSTRPLIVTSGVALLSGQTVTEDMRAPAESPNPRVATEQAVDAALQTGADVRVVRLPIVHGDGDHGFIAMLIGLAREKGVSAYANDGGNCWPAAHQLDVARVYTLALAKGEAGKRYHAVSEAGIALRDIAGVIGRRLGVPVIAKTGAEIEPHFTWFSHFVQMNAVASSAWTRDALGWAPTMPGMLADLNASTHYFAG